LNNHQRDECPRTIVSCSLHVIGCQWTGARELSDDHDLKSLSSHNRLLMKSLIDTKNELKATKEQLNGTRTSLANLTKKSYQSFGIFTFALRGSSFVTPNYTQPLPPTLVPRIHAAAVRLGTNIYVSGGYDCTSFFEGSTRAVSSIERLALSTGTWSKSPSSDNKFFIPTPRAYHALVSFDSTLVIIGGASYHAFDDTLASCEKYSPSNNDWSSFPSLTTPRKDFASEVFNSGPNGSRQIFCFGSGSYESSCEMYDHR
jgi:hypothetical protein